MNMLQASLRSVVYRSFVICDDPKGVIECGTIRKTKSGPQKIEGKIETQRISKNPNKSSSSVYKITDKETGEMLSNSKGTLQEEKDPSSLQLMEVSRGAQKLNRVIDSWSNGVSVEGQSRDIANDLLKGALDLKESVMMLGKLQEASQYMNKIKKKEKENGKDEFGVQRSNSDRFSQNFEVGFRNPSPSGNGSSRDCYEELREVIRKSFARQNLLPNKPYEEKAYFHSKKVDSSPDLPSTSSSRSTMVYTQDFSSSNFSFSSKGGTEEKPNRSNLIAKLMGLEEASAINNFDSICQENTEKEKVNVNQRRPVFDIDMMRHMPKSRKPHSLVQKSEREKMMLDEIIKMMQLKGLLNCNKPRTRSYIMNSCVEETYSFNSPPIVIMKPRRTPEGPSMINECRGGVLNSIERRRKLRVEETPVKKISPEKGSGFKKAVLAKQEDKEVKIKEIISLNKTKGSVPSCAKQDKKETIEKKVDKIQKMAPSRRKSMDMENLKSTSVLKIVEQSKQSPTKQRKVENKSNTTRGRISQPKSTSLNSVSQKSSERKKGVRNEKPISRSLSTKIGCKDAEFAINLTCETKPDMSATLHSEEEAVASETVVTETCDNINTLVSDDVTLPSTQQGSVLNSTKEAERNNLLLNNLSFLDDAYSLFNVNTYECETNDSRLLLDCKNEILEHESQRQILTFHPLLLKNRITRSRFCIDSDKLVAKVHEGIENLKSYTSAGAKRAPADAVYGVLERDLGCRGGVGGGWGVGWREGYRLGEIEEVVDHIYKLVLSQLIEEVVLGFWGLVFMS